MKHRLLKKSLSLFIVIMLMAALPIQAFAAEYDLAQGAVVVNAGTGGVQTVTHGSNAAVEDAAPVVTGTYTGDGPAISFDSTGDATANATIRDVTINPASGVAIEVGDSNALINVEGTNQVNGFDNPDNTFIFGADPNGAAIHLNSGNVEITSASGGVLNMYVDGGSPAIGCDGVESLTGDITISGSVDLNITNEGTAAGIGGAVYSDVSGDVVICDEASVSFDGSKNCVGISNVGGGVMSGCVSLEDNASVELSENGRIGSPYQDLMDENTTFTIAGTASINGKYGSDAVDENARNFKHVVAEPPVTPEDPEAPENPEDPETPENPEDPESPEVPEDPETPEVSENPAPVNAPNYIVVPISCEGVTVYAKATVSGSAVTIYEISSNDLEALKGNISVDLTTLAYDTDSLVFPIDYLENTGSIEIVYKAGTAAADADTVASAIAGATGDALCFTLSGGKIEITNA